jgi:glycosyltransferase involved in cell wall biosynthesis
MKECDIYVQPSRYEGNCVAVREAQILGKPVVITNYSTALSQINDGKDGVIVPLDNQKCAEGIIKLILDSELQNRIKNSLKLNDYGNEKDVNLIYDLL